ncbi:hypothetical protein LMANV2_370096 [Leptospira interrogans serovar Manilae]|uniref:Uncharacterized protein n=1 Tax=Leptospira interrogans serovar Manilae TaxID=214675 RepID=A0AAQ1SP20_LEPIR|nr:hypothetical protein LMANV2_370096 [Leptospira interrogans serovar Manilae]
MMEIFYFLLMQSIQSISNNTDLSILFPIKNGNFLDLFILTSFFGYLKECSWYKK